MQEAVVTGFSVISPFGLEPEEFAEKMFGGESAVHGIGSIVKDTEFPIRGAGLLPDGIFPDINLGLYRQEVEVLIKKMLDNYLQRAGGWASVDGIIYGTNSGYPKFNDVKKYHSNAGDLDLDNFYAEHGLNYLMKYLSENGQESIEGRDIVVCVNGCITGLTAISYALKRIKLGLNKRILVLCDESRVRPEDLLKYNSIGALSKENFPPEKISRPFSKSRSGFVKGEGAGMVIVEERKGAEKRGAHIYASLLGYGQSSDAWRMTDGREDLKGMLLAMEKAFADCGVRPEQIDYINAHGTSTPKNDFLETAGLKKFFGSRAYDIPVSSLKSQIGHLNYACGIVETIACLMMLGEQRVAPTINYDDPDPLCDLYFVPNKSEKRKLKYILKNSYGFGGCNASLILGDGNLL